MKQLFITLFALCVASVTTTIGKTPQIFGSVVSSDVTGRVPGVYSIPTATTSDFSLSGATEAANGGGVMADGVYYATNFVDYGFYAQVRIYPYSTESWECLINSYIYGASTSLTSDMAVDPVSGNIYGAFLSSSRDSWELATISFDLSSERADISTIAPLEKQMSALAFDSSGQLFGIDIQGSLYKIDKNTATLDKVGDTGIATNVDVSGYAPTNPASGAIDPQSGNFYWTVVTADGKSQLYEVNTSTASVSLLNTFPGNEVIRGLYIQAPEAEDGAPAIATDLAAKFPPGSLNGTVSFTAPTSTYGGEPLSGNLGFRILANGSQIATGTVYTGVNRSVNITVPAIGEYEITVILSNPAGDGPAAKIKAFAGYNAPDTPEVTVRDYYGSLKVEWTPVTMADAKVSYRVVRYPDNVVVAESTSDTDLIDRIPTSERAVAYQYGVTAVANGTSSEEGFSNIIVTGRMTPPYTETFPNVESTDVWTVIDSNNDQYTWSFYYGEMRAQANSSTAADDWLISPPVAIEGFKYYVVSVDVKSESAVYPGKFELRYGLSPTAEGMTSTLVEPTVINHEGYVTYKATLRTIDDNKNYYFGIHALTEPDMWWFRATNFAVSAPVADTAPASPSSLSITPDFNGALSAQVTVKAPDTTIAGSSLASLSKVEVFRDGHLIHCETPVMPGQEIKFTDSDFTGKGTYRYTAVATNDSGSGPEAVAAVFVGINKPASPNNARAAETATNGEVTVTWDAPTTYIDGTPLNPDLVTYSIYTPIYGEDTKILTDIKGTSATFQAIFPDEEQTFFYYGVTASTEEGENLEMALTEQLPLGEPYPAPYCDSFANISTEYSYGTGAVDSQTYWDFYSDTAFEDVQSQDGDNGMFAMFGSDRGKWASFQTGKVDLDGLDNPMLTFYTYNMTGSLPDDNTIEVLVNDRDGFHPAGKWKLSDFITEGWHRVEIPLAQYAGKEVYFKFVGTIDTYQYTHVDNIQLRDRKAHDLAITSITAPERVKAGNEEAIDVAYGNFGLSHADNFTIELYRGDEKIDTREVNALPSDGRGTTRFVISHSVAMTTPVEYHATLVYGKDLDLSNNSSANVTVATIQPNYPTVTDLTATTAATDPLKVTLSWNVPDISGNFDEEITDGFEEYTSWTNSEIGNWQLLDEDGGAIYGFGTFFDMPGIPAGSRQAWWVMDATYQPMVDHFSSPDFYTAHSGDKYLAQMSVMAGDNSVRCDDWAISPRLSGSRQTISLYARSFFDTDPETFELLYSTSGSDISDFTLLETKSKVPNTWTKYFFDLPEGAEHFAIRCTSRDCFMLMIDDVTYTPAGEGNSLEITGYNAYRNGIKLNDSPITDTRYETSRPDQGEHVFTVTAIYKNRGESRFSNEAIPDMAGISAVEMSDRVFVHTAPGEIIVKNAEGCQIDIHGIDGRAILSTEGDIMTRIPVIQGIYLVSVANRAFKVVVRK